MVIPCRDDLIVESKHDALLSGFSMVVAEQVQQPVVTNGSAALRQIAQERDWRILDLFETP